jgi:hypothetical protein
MSFSAESRTFLTMTTNGKIPFGEQENVLLLGDKKAKFQSANIKKSLYGFSYEEHGLVIYNLFEGHWLIIGDYETTSLNPRTWFYSNFIKAIECIPKQDCIISWIHLQEEILTKEERKTFLKTTPSLKLFAFSDSTEKMKLQIEKDGVDDYQFQGLEFGTFKNHLLVKAYKNLKELWDPFILSL